MGFAPLTGLRPVVVLGICIFVYLGLIGIHFFYDRVDLFGNIFKLGSYGRIIKIIHVDPPFSIIIEVFCVFLVCKTISYFLF